MSDEIDKVVAIADRVGKVLLSECDSISMACHVAGVLFAQLALAGQADPDEMANMVRAAMRAGGAATSVHWQSASGKGRVS